MLLSSAKFKPKAQEVMKTGLTSNPIRVELVKHQGGSVHEEVTLEDSDPGSAGLMLYTSGTTNRPVRILHTHNTADVPHAMLTKIKNI